MGSMSTRVDEIGVGDALEPFAPGQVHTVEAIEPYSEEHARGLIRITLESPRGERLVWIMGPSERIRRLK